MSQGFFVVNITKKEYIGTKLLPFRFKSLINNSLIGSLLTRLVCTSENNDYRELKNSSYYAEKYMGSWSGDTIKIMGDYQEEMRLREIYSEGKNISSEVLAMYFDQEREKLDEAFEYNFAEIAEIGLLNNCPKSIIYALENKVGHDWKNKYYKEIYKYNI